MRFRYRSPFDWSISMGGVGDSVSYVKPQNCPQAGELIRTEDTSRYVNDYIDQSFWMPYSVPVYTNGNCGETFGSEVWGLQYLPAGWITNTGTDNISVTWYYSAYNGEITQGTTDIRWSAWQDTEDGTGINYRNYVQSGDYIADGAHIASSFDGNTYRWFVARSGDSTSFSDYTMYDPYGTWSYDGSQDAYLYITEIDNSVIAGTENYSSYSDGYGGYYSMTTSVYWYQGGTGLVTINSYNSISQDPLDQINYANGIINDEVAVMNGGSPNGDGTYTIQTFSNGSYYPQGEYVRTLADYPNYSYWNSYSFTNGTGTRDDRQWDGNGGFQTASGISYGSYSYDYIGNYYNEYDYYYYDLYHDGYGGIIAYQT
jgi:hypothetical protein